MEFILQNLAKYSSIFMRFRKMNLMVMFEYRADFFFWGFVSGMWTVFNFFFTALLVGSTGSLAGWSQQEMFVLISVFTIYDAFTWSFFYHNMRYYMNYVFSGELDKFLVRPIDAQFMLSVEHNSYNNLIRLFIGIGMLIHSLISLGRPLSPLTLIMFFIQIVLGFFLMYSLWFMIATGAFWVDRLQNLNDVLPSLRRLSQVPRGVYTGIASFLFCVVLPIVLVTSIPTETLVGKSSFSWNIYYLLFSVFIFWFARRFFFFSIKKYSGAGA
jgi:ABC-2 type transport system permease protein